MKHTTLFTALIVLAGGAAGIQPAEVENVTLQIDFNASEVYRSGTQTTPGEHKPSSYPYLSSDEPEALVPYGDTEELTSIYMPDGLVAYYPLDETSGDTANDITTTLPDNDGQVVGAKQGAEGNISTAYSFDGIDDAIVIGDSLNPDTVTVSAWVKPGTNNADEGIVTSLGDTGDAPQYGLVTEGSGFGFNVTNVAGSETATTSSFDPGRWHHVAGTFDGAKTRIYLNASRRDQDSISGDIPETQSDLEIGSTDSGNARNFNGTIDDVRIYNRSLSQEEIERLYDYIRDQPGAEQISATISSGSFLLANTKGGTPSIESRREAVESRNLLGRVDPSFGFTPSRSPTTTNIIYRSPYNLTGDSFSSASSGISLRNTAGLGDNATVSVTPIG